MAQSAHIDPDAHLGPHCVVGERVRIGARSVLLGGNHVGDDCQIGEDVRLYQNVVLYADTRLGHRVRIHAGTVIGSDGFGYVFDAGPQLRALTGARELAWKEVAGGAERVVYLGERHMHSSIRNEMSARWPGPGRCSRTARSVCSPPHLRSTA